MFGEEMKEKKTNRIQNHFSFLFRVWCFSHFIILLLLSLFTLFRSLLLTEYDQNRYSRIYRVADCPICVVGEMTTYTPTPICISNAQLCRWRFVQFHLVPRIRYSSKFLENKYRNCSSFLEKTNHSSILRKFLLRLHRALALQTFCIFDPCEMSKYHAQSRSRINSEQKYIGYMSMRFIFLFFVLFHRLRSSGKYRNIMSSLHQ